MVNWDLPIEAVFQNTTSPASIIRVDDEGWMVRWYCDETPWSGMFVSNGTPVMGGDWTIRNVTTQPKSPPIPDNIAARAVALVRRITESAVLKDTGWAIDARDILSDLEPVDPDIEVANALRVDAYMSDTGSQPIDWIDTAIRNAIAKGRQMQKDGE